MTLKEKFDNIIGQSSPIEWENKCEQIADEFAIGFAEWICRNDYSIQFYFQQDTMNELLEIYKQEISNL